MNKASESGGILVFLQMLGEGMHPVGKKTAEIAAGLALGAGCPLAYVRAADGKTPREYGALLISAIEQARPEVVMAGSTAAGKIAASIAAVRFDAGIAADCTELSLDSDMALFQKRPAFGGDVTAWVRTDSRPQIVTVCPDIVSGMERGADFFKFAREIRPVIYDREPSGYKVLETRRLPENSGIEDAALVIALGGGVPAEDTVETVADLAKRLGGEIAGSRAIVQRGWLPPERQIGLSGRAVSPKLLITLGVSGSQQFLAGIKGSKYIVAVNNDENAPILAASNLPIRCDLNDVLANLERRLKKDNTGKDL